MFLSGEVLGRDRLILAATVDEAQAALARGARLLAGGTWLMRAPLRGAGLQGDFVAISRIAGLDRISDAAGVVTIGAMASHDAIAQAFAGDAQLSGLAMAAGKAANPAVRRTATLGGNLCATGFAAADLPPALLALDAQVELAGPSGAVTLPVADFLARRDALLTDHLLTALHLTRGATQRSGHARLPMRKAGDYPAAIVSLAFGPDGARVAVGAVEDTARRWSALEAALGAMPDPSPAAAEAAARAHLDGFDPRDGLDAPGWYRLSVLPALVRRAVAAANGQEVR